MTNPEITNHTSRNLQMGGNDHEVKTLLAAEVVLKGTLLGIVTASGKVRVAKSAAVDGSQHARYISAEALSPAGDANLTVVSKGEVDDSLVLFDGADTFATVPAGQPDSYLEQLRDFGIKAKTFSDHYIEDNQP